MEAINDDRKKALILDWLVKNGHLSCKVSTDGYVWVSGDFILREAREGERVGEELNPVSEITNLLKP